MGSIPDYSLVRGLEQALKDRPNHCRGRIAFLLIGFPGSYGLPGRRKREPQNSFTGDSDRLLGLNISLAVTVQLTFRTRAHFHRIPQRKPFQFRHVILASDR